MIEAGLGKKVHEVFAWLDETPIGAASIGQVHRATLLEGGKAVVVKVQYPEVRKLFDSDFTQIAAACCFWTPQVGRGSGLGSGSGSGLGLGSGSCCYPYPYPWQAMGEMAELRKQFMAELDFRREAKVMDQVGTA